MAFSKNFETMLTRFSKRTSLQNDANTSSGQSQIQDSDITWSSDPWTCGKQLKHYGSFSLREANIEVHSFVWILNEEIEAHVAYIEDMYEDLQGVKMVTVRYFLFVEDIKLHVRELLLPEPQELFVTPKLYEVDATSIDGIAAVLNPEDFEKCKEYLPLSLTPKTFVSYREFNDGTVLPFDLSHLEGYSKQPILICHLEGDSKEANNQVLEITDTIERLDIASPSNDPRESMLEVSHQENRVFPMASDDVEVLSQDSSLRGCWFKCKVLHLSSSGNRIRVEYYDLLNTDGPTNKVMETVPIRVANPDTLHMRLNGRSTIRPWPQHDASELIEFELGKQVDVWWCDGWWEGVMIGQHQSPNPKLKIFLPGEKILLVNVDKKDVRNSMEWFEGKWVSLEAKPDILSSIRLLPYPQFQLLEADRPSHAVT